MKLRSWQNLQRCSTLRWRVRTVVPRAVTDARYVFEGHTAPGAVIRADNHLAETMIDILGKPVLQHGMLAVNQHQERWAILAGLESYLVEPLPTHDVAG